MGGSGSWALANEAAASNAALATKRIMFMNSLLVLAVIAQNARTVREDSVLEFTRVDARQCTVSKAT
jgi:hypothetical protein